jgi:putative ABC transport system permease protein
MRSWVLAGLRRGPGPLIGTVVASAMAATLSVAAISIAAADTKVPAGRLAGASVVVTASTSLNVTSGGNQESVPLDVYRGVPASLAQRIDQVPGVATATGESGFPGGLVRAGDVDVIAVTGRPGISPDVLAGRIRVALHRGQGYTIATGTARGDVADLNAAVERSNGGSLAAAMLPPIILIAMFVLAATTALAVNLRTRRFALLRAVGASRGQVRRAVLAELILCGLAGGALGYPLGQLAGTLGTRALASHQMLPAGSTAWLSPLLLLAACGISAIVAGLSGQVAARRASRTPPARALRESVTERTWPHPVRVLLGLAAAGGAGTLMVFTLTQKNPAGQLALALPLLLACMVAVALLGPLLVVITAAAARPLRVLGGPSARLALAAITAQPRRAASAVIPVAMAVAMAGSVYFADASIEHATAAQAGNTVTASQVVTGNGLTSSTLTRIRNLPGVRTAVGVAPVTLAATDPDLEPVYGEAVSDGPVSQVLNLGVSNGTLSSLRPGQIAVSALEAGSGNLGVHLGSTVTVYLPDGTPYRATVSAIYARSLATGDLLIPASVVTGHTGAAAGFGQILVTGGNLKDLGTANPGLHVTSGVVANAQSAQAASQNGFANNLILTVLVLLAGVALVNTLVVSTTQRRRSLRLLGRVGATRGQVVAMFGWHVLFVTFTGLVAGAAAGAVTMLTVTRAVTGSWTPFIALGPAAALVAGVAAITAAAVLIPVQVMVRREPALAAA